MENQRIITDYRLKLNANNIVLTECAEWTGPDLKKNRTKQDANLKDNRTKGVLSPKSVKRLKSSINWLVISSEKKKRGCAPEQRNYNFKINFITLTIPPQLNTTITEHQFKLLLNTFLTYHRKYNNLNNYVWKIETHKDGRFHIHITTDTFIWHKKIKDSWNMILKRNGMLEYHYSKFQNYAPPSTDIKSVKKVRKLAAYMAKYMTKNNKENPMFRGRVWGCSMKISKVLNNVTYVCPSVIGEVTKPIFDLGRKMLEVFSNPNVFGNTYKVADIYLLDVVDWVKLKGSFIYEVFKELILFLRKETSRDSQLCLEFSYG